MCSAEVLGWLVLSADGWTILGTVPLRKLLCKAGGDESGVGAGRSSSSHRMQACYWYILHAAVNPVETALLQLVCMCSRAQGIPPIEDRDQPWEGSCWDSHESAPGHTIQCS